MPVALDVQNRKIQKKQCTSRLTDPDRKGTPRKNWFAANGRYNRSLEIGT